MHDTAQGYWHPADTWSVLDQSSLGSHWSIFFCNRVADANKPINKNVSDVLLNKSMLVYY